MTVRLQGFSELEKKLKDLSKAAGKGALRKSLKSAAEPIAKAAAANAVRKSGELQDSFAVSTQLSKRQRSKHRKIVRDDKASVEVFVGAGPISQAHLEEFGSMHNAPRPMLRPAWDAGRDQLLVDLGDNLMTEIDKAIGRAVRKAAKLARG